MLIGFLFLWLDYSNLPYKRNPQFKIFQACLSDKNVCIIQTTDAKHGGEMEGIGKGWVI